MRIGPAEEFDEESEQPVAHQVKARHLVVKNRNLAQVPKDGEKPRSFEYHFVKLARMVQNRVRDRTVVGQREIHADGARGDFAKEFTINEVAPTSPGVGEGSRQKAQVQCLPQVHLVALDTDNREDRPENHAAMVAHAGNPGKVVAEFVAGERQDDFHRVGKIVAGLVEENVAETRADEDTGDSPGEETVEIFLGVAEAFLLVDFPHCSVGRDEREDVHDAVPADREVAELDGRAVKIGRDKVPPRKIHASFLCSSSGAPNNL